MYTDPPPGGRGPSPGTHVPFTGRKAIIARHWHPMPQATSHKHWHRMPYRVINGNGRGNGGGKVRVMVMVEIAQA
jgi:hypothetical protein